MRGVYWASSIGLVAAGFLATEGLASSAAGHNSLVGTPLAAVYSGKRACGVGLVEVVVEVLPRLRSGSSGGAAMATAWVSIDGRHFSQTAAPRVLVDGSKFRGQMPAKDSQVEVLVDLGRRCGWIRVARGR